MIMRMFDDGEDDFFSDDPHPSGDLNALEPTSMTGWQIMPLSSEQMVRLEEAHQAMPVPQMMSPRRRARIRLHDDASSENLDFG